MHFSTEVIDTALQVVSATTTLVATVVGQPTPLELRVVLAELPESTRVSPQMRLDLSPIGLTSTFPLQHEGAGHYRASTTITPLQTGRYYLPVMVETVEDGDWYHLFTVTLAAYPSRDLSIYEEGPSDGWKVEATRATSDLQATEYVHSGTFSHAITLQPGGISNTSLKIRRACPPLDILT